MVSFRNTVTIKEKIYFRGAHIAITGYCNFRCLHCYSNSSPEINIFLSFPEIVGIIKDIKKLGVLTLYVGGGEPFAHPNFINIIKYIRSLNILPSISTNGSLLTKTTLQKLYDVGFRHNLYVSLDGSESKINDRVRGQGTYDRIISGLKILSEFKKIQFAITMVSNKHNIGDALKTALLAKDMGARFFNICKVDKDGRGEINEQFLSITQSEFLSEVSTIEKKFECLGNYFGQSYVFALHENDQCEFVQDTANAKFDNQKIPFGISVDYKRNVQLTPMKVSLGLYTGCNSLYNLVKRALNDKIINEKFVSWFNRLRNQ